MVFSSLTFLLLFFPIFLALYFCVRSIAWRNGLLLAASLLFYGWSDPVWILAMLFTTLVNYYCALKIAAARGRRRRGRWLAAAIIVSLGFLFYFKYAGFFIGSLGALLGAELTFSPVLPIGISFYTFQILTYTIDVYRKEVGAQKRFSRLLLYVSCFPQLIAGPIVRYQDVAARIGGRETTVEDFSSGMRRFAVGLSKKVLLANVCGAMLEKTALAGSGAAMSTGGAWLSAFLYALQLYFDFSAYSDMAIGIGRVLGFRYRENFDYPYISRSASEFWRRWHISLGAFFREYVYIPLGGNRGGGPRTALNIMIVWMLTGLWHGASWNFIIWGAYYGALLIIERFVLARALLRVPSILRWAATFALTLIGWVIFYYTDLSDAATHLLAMAGFGRDSSGALIRLPALDEAARALLRGYTIYPLIAFACSLPLCRRIRDLAATSRAERRLNAAGTVALTCLMALSVLFLIGQSYNPFIYFRF